MSFFSKKARVAADLSEFSELLADETPTALTHIYESLEEIKAQLDRAQRPTSPARVADNDLGGLLYDRMVMPIVEDLMAYYDRLQQVIAPMMAAPDLALESRRSLASLNAEILEILARQGVEQVRASTLDPAVHQVRSRISTPRLEQDRQVARSHRCGFRRAGIMLRREEVDVYRHE